MFTPALATMGKFARTWLSITLLAVLVSCDDPHKPNPVSATSVTPGPQDSNQVIFRTMTHDGHRFIVVTRTASGIGTSPPLVLHHPDCCQQTKG